VFIIIIIIIIINCNWVVTRWQWLFYMYTNIQYIYAVLCMMAAVHLVDTNDFKDLEECTDCPFHQGIATTLMMEAADYFKILVCMCHTVWCYITCTM